ncbi:hypothetical protein [Mangrovihabitans endophyticus]|uniref:Secreted protein n=1 Tax=Mangrovihabitans endophyticus TaxID=1751298 RepID=A0A8J3BWM4_9ACTN|nr:hypothetical protein [Mangrovihabitans endophyticus]GGK77713.1 hypothetical protein GCM10012284_09580 [Mangrovihabitans endophyticus]
MDIVVKRWLAGVAAVTVAAGGAAALTVPALAEAGAEDPPSLVEDYSYPGAAAILDQQNIKLISGDGNIVLADCTDPPDGDITFIYVYTSDLSVNDGDAVCFQVLGTPGVLAMEVPAVFEIRGDGRIAGSGDGHDMTAVVKPQGGAAKTIELDPDGSTPVGIGTSPPGAPTTLLKLTARG